MLPAKIESLTKQKVEVVPLPTPAALQAKRLEGTRAAILKRVATGALDDMRALVASLAHDTDVVDIAAAAIALVHEEAEAMSAPAPATAPEPSYSGIIQIRRWLQRLPRLPALRSLQARRAVRSIWRSGHRRPADAIERQHGCRADDRAVRRRG